MSEKVRSQSWTKRHDEVLRKCGKQLIKTAVKYPKRSWKQARKNQMLPDFLNMSQGKALKCKEQLTILFQ